MEGGGQDAALAYQRGEAVAPSDHFDARAGGDDARSADEDHLQRAAGEGGCGGHDGRVDLAAIGVALDGGVEPAEGALGGG